MFKITKKDVVRGLGALTAAFIIGYSTRIPDRNPEVDLGMVPDSAAIVSDSVRLGAPAKYVLDSASVRNAGARSDSVVASLYDELIGGSQKMMSDDGCFNLSAISDAVENSNSNYSSRNESFYDKHGFEPYVESNKGGNTNLSAGIRFNLSPRRRFKR